MKITFGEIIKKSKEYHNDPGRELIYKYATELVESKDSKKKIDGVSILLIGWNWGYYSRQNVKFIRDEIEELVQIFKNDYSNLFRDSFLIDFNFSEKNKFNEKEKKIIRLFNKFVKKLGPTGASKVLHILKPGLFVMWDSKIRTNYKNSEPGKYYLKFMKKERNKIKDFKKFKKYKEKLPKLLDEYNYVEKHRKNS